MYIHVRTHRPLQSGNNLLDLAFFPFTPFPFPFPFGVGGLEAAGDGADGGEGDSSGAAWRHNKQTDRESLTYKS